MIDCPIFLFGMIRSGTTLLSRTLSTHKNLLMASDPYMHFFKSFRNEYMLYKGNENFDCDTPLGEEIIKSNINNDNKIIFNHFNYEILNIQLSEIKDKIISQALRDSPKIIPYIKKIKSNNYGDLLDKLIEIIQLSYGNPNKTMYGFKTTFAEQFISPILNRFKKAKIIIIIRDPRAIYASHINEHEKQYPLLFIIKQWRKSVLYALKHMHQKKNVFIVKYEDLILKKNLKLREICEFLELEFDKIMLDENRLIDGKGNKWIRNTSYNIEDKKEVNLFAWQDKLSKRTIKFIEYLTKFELEKFGYDVSFNSNNFIENIEPIHEIYDDIYDWIKPYYDNYKLSDKVIKDEYKRIKIMQKNISGYDLDSNILSNFLYKEFINMS